MEKFPVELRQVILQVMDLPTLKAMRLTSKAWAGIGEEYLVSPKFTSLPHRDDMNRLLAMSSHPKYSYRIESLFFLLGEVNEYHARHNTYFLQYMRDSEEWSHTSEEAWARYNQLKLLKERYLPLSCQPDLLTTALQSLPNLKEIHISLMTSPFQGADCPGLLQDIWAIPSTRLLPRVATTERFTNILTSVTSSSAVNRITALSHDRLPFEFFAQRALLISLFSTAFNSLISLSLTLDYSDMPNDLHGPQAFQNLSQCLRCSEGLQSLSLAFHGRKKTSISPLLSSFAEHAFSWSQLESIRLEGLAATERELGNFLVQMKSLKKVQLGGAGVKARHQPPNGGVHLEAGSFKGLFLRLREQMRLESIEAMGDLRGLESGELWILEGLEREENLREFVTD